MSIRKTLTLALLPALALLAACNDTGGTTGAGASVALIDQNRLFMESQAGKQGMEMLQSMSADLQAQLQAMQEEMAKEGTEEENQERSRRFQQTLSAAQARMGAEQNRIVGTLQDNVDEVLTEYRKQRGIAVILPLESALSHDPSMDITDEIIAALDKRKIEFGKIEAEPQQPVEQPAPVEPSTPERPAQTEPSAPEQSAGQPNQ